MMVLSILEYGAKAVLFGGCVCALRSDSVPRGVSGAEPLVCLVEGGASPAERVSKVGRRADLNTARMRRQRQ